MAGERARVYLRRRIAAVAALVLMAGIGTYIPLTLLAPLTPAAAQLEPISPTVSAAQQLALPADGSTAVGAVDFDGILASSGSDAARPIASISKVITALVVLDARPLAAGETGPDIAFTAADTSLYDKYLRANGKVEPVQSGVVMTEHDVLEVVLATSANNYTESLADWAFETEPAFVEATAGWLNEHGFTGTRLVEPTGMSPGNVSTAMDLVGIGKLALAHPVVADIVSAKVVEVPLLGALKNSNELLGVDGIDGIKTGTLDEAGACLLFSADYPVGSSVVTVVGVVLGGVDHKTVDVAVRALLDGVADGFHEVILAEKGQPFASYETEWDQETTAVATIDASVIVWSDTPVSGTISASDLVAGGIADAGSPAGEVTFTAGDRSITVPLKLKAAIRDPGPWWRLTHPVELLSR